jgi:Xaa-Pro dipeptidase
LTNRIEKLNSLIQKSELDAVVVNPGASFRYLTGLQFHLMERPVVLIVALGGQPVLILPKLEAAKLEELTFKCQVRLYGDDPATWQEEFDHALADFQNVELRIGVEPTGLRYLELEFLRKSLPLAEFVDGSQVFAQLRMRKDANELTKMRKAAEIAENALLSTLRTIRVGQTEKEIAAELLMQLYRHGSDQELPFAPIVASGPNTANPHASPSQRRVDAGDVLLFDWGAGYEGYFSDITRCFFVEMIDQRMVEIAETVQHANHYAVAAGKAGMTAGQVDAVARDEIEKNGFGEYFTHRTGHGLGMEAHEAPYIFSGSDLTLEEGMVFTIEPGIYLPGLGGVRIEDDVVVERDGLTSLTTLPREVMTIEKYLQLFEFFEKLV